METLTALEVDVRWREEAILGGYRRPNQSLRGALRSLFYWHNESINMWSHLIPALTWTVLALSEDYAGGPNDATMKLFYASMVGTPLISATAHTLNIMGPVANDLCYIADYFVIASHAFHTAMAVHVFGLPDHWSRLALGSSHPWISAVVAVLAIGVSGASRFAKKSCTKTPARIRVIVFLTAVGFMHAPQVVRVFLCGLYGECMGGEGLHFGSMSLQLIAALAYGTHLPERLAPGRFDFFGHSHNVLHLVGTLGAECQRRAALWDYKSPSRPSLPSHPHPLPPLIFPLYYAAALITLAVLVTARFALENRLHSPSKLKSPHGNSGPKKRPDLRQRKNISNGSCSVYPF